MLEFYQAYATYEDLMDLTEELSRAIAEAVNGGKLQVEYQGDVIDLTPPWRRFSMVDAIAEIGKVPREVLLDPQKTAEAAHSLGLAAESFEGHGKLLTKIFDQTVEPKLIQPTFISHYPLEVSPLSRRCEFDPSVTDRFELFIAGREMAAMLEPTIPGTSVSGSCARSRRARREMRKRTPWMRITSGRWNTACPPRQGKG